MWTQSRVSLLKASGARLCSTTELTSHYTHQLWNLKYNVDCWFYIQFGSNRNPELIGKSTNNLTLAHILDEKEILAFPVAVQDSDDTVVVGFFLYSGKWCNAKRVSQVLKETAVAMGMPARRFGCTVKAMREISTKGCKLSRYMSYANAIQV